MDYDIQYEDKIFDIFDSIHEVKPPFDEIVEYSSYLKGTNDVSEAYDYINNHLQVGYNIRKELKGMVECHGLHSKFIKNFLLNILL